MKCHEKLARFIRHRIMVLMDILFAVDEDDVRFEYTRRFEDSSNILFLGVHLEKCVW